MKQRGDQELRAGDRHFALLGGRNRGLDVIADANSSGYYSVCNHHLPASGQEQMPVVKGSRVVVPPGTTRKIKVSEGSLVVRVECERGAFVLRPVWLLKRRTCSTLRASRRRRGMAQGGRALVGAPVPQPFVNQETLPKAERQVASGQSELPVARRTVRNGDAVRVMFLTADSDGKFNKCHRCVTTAQSGAAVLDEIYSPAVTVPL